MNSAKALVGVAVVGIALAGVTYYYVRGDSGSKAERSSFRHRATMADSKIIEEQNAEFFRSQQEDLRKERERKEQEELARVTAESLRTAQLEEEMRKKTEEMLKEADNARRKEEIFRYRQSLVEKLEPEPPREPKGDYVTCMVRLPCGAKKTRRLAVNSKVQNLHDFVETLALEVDIPERYLIVADYLEGGSQPRVLDNMEQTLVQAGLTRFSSFTVRIEEQFDEDEVNDL